MAVLGFLQGPETVISGGFAQPGIRLRARAEQKQGRCQVVVFDVVVKPSTWGHDLSAGCFPEADALRIQPAQ